MKKPWTLRLVALGSATKIAYSANFAPRYWTRRGAARQASLLNAETGHHNNYLWVPALTRKEPW